MICVSIQEKDFKLCSKVLACCEMAELRADLCGFTPQQTAELTKDHKNILITCRTDKCSADEALAHYKAAIEAGARYADVDMGAPLNLIDQVRQLCSKAGCTFVISSHDFEGTKSTDELLMLYRSCIEAGADIVKIVTTAHSVSDASKVMKLYSLCPADNLPVAFCMGEAGKFTRLLCLDLGARWTYAALTGEQATAPGQYTAAQLLELSDANHYPYECPSLADTIFSNRAPAVCIPCSKSIAQRAILAAAFAKGTTILHNYEPCNDINGALEVVRKLGAQVSASADTVTITSPGAAELKIGGADEGTPQLHIGESGLLTRLILPFCAYLAARDGNSIIVSGSGSILTRSLAESYDALTAAGATCSPLGQDKHLPVEISGNFRAGEIRISGSASSQIVSGFLMTLPLMGRQTRLIVDNPASIPYIELTLRVLRSFGISIANHSYREFIIPSGLQYRATETYLDSDWSSAAYFAAAGALHSGMTLRNMAIDSAQADEKILEILKLYGYGIDICKVSDELADITVTGEAQRRAPEAEESFVIDLTDAPDLFPTVVALACFQARPTILSGAQRLLAKESNRAESILEEFSRIGADIEVDGNIMRISPARLRGGLCSSHNDHRIAMSLAIATLDSPDRVWLNNIKCIDKSFPSFLTLLKNN